MAGRIRILDDTVANRIAAGEVVERPAAVVRELLDNAIDSGAKRIQVDVRRGGKSLIAVTDDGCGMSREDALLCLERHATSKISETGDLEEVETLGFRGEALPSIAAVGKFRLQTREADAVAGTEILVDGGKIRDVRDAGCPVGTRIELRSLFFHTPARRKFLKSDVTEALHCEQAFRSAALAHPEVGFHYRHESSQWDYPGAQDGDERIRQVMGKDWMTWSLGVDAAEGPYRIRGRIGHPGVSRSHRNESILFVNRRRVSHRGLQFAILEGYQQSLVKGRYPVYVLAVELPGCEVDVNIHPAKQEVKIRDEVRVRTLVAGAVAEALARAAEEKRRPVTRSEPPPPRPVGPRIEWAQRPAQASIPEEPEPETGDSGPPEVRRGPTRNHDLVVHGTLLDQYIMAENEQGAVMVDVRAARERILFEEALSRLADEAPVSQKLLVPVTIELDSDQAEWVVQYLPALQGIGLGIAELGGATFLVDGLPPVLSGSEVDSFVPDLVRSMMAGAPVRRSLAAGDEMIARGYAIQAARRLPFPNDAEIDRLLVDLHACDLPYTDASGRPTMILFSREELKRRFARK